MTTKPAMQNEAAISGDLPVRVTMHATERLSDAYRPYERFHFSIDGPDGAPVAFDREVLRAGNVIGVLTLDLSRREVILIRQFRIAAHLATGRGELVELVAGKIDGNESAREAAIRECQEEITLTPRRMVEVLTFIPAGAFADELMSLWIADVDSAALPELAGHEEEGEIIRPFRLPIDTALDLLARNVWRSAPLVIALQWLALNLERLDQILQSDQSS